MNLPPYGTSQYIPHARPNPPHEWQEVLVGSPFGLDTGCCSSRLIGAMHAWRLSPSRDETRNILREGG